MQTCGGGWLLALAAGWVRAIARGINGPWAIHARSASCSLGRQGKHVGQAGRGLVGFLGGSAEEQSVISSLPRIGCHTAGFDFNSEWPRDLMPTTKSFVIAWRGSIHMELDVPAVNSLGRNRDRTAILSIRCY